MVIIVIVTSWRYIQPCYPHKSPSYWSFFLILASRATLELCLSGISRLPPSSPPAASPSAPEPAAAKPMPSARPSYEGRCHCILVQLEATVATVATVRKCWWPDIVDDADGLMASTCVFKNDLMANMEFLWELWPQAEK